MCLLFYVLATAKVISGRKLTCKRPHWWWLYSTATLGNHGVVTMTWFPTQPYYPDTEVTNHCPPLFIRSVSLGNEKCLFNKIESTKILNPEPCMGSLCSTDYSSIKLGYFWSKHMKGFGTALLSYLLAMETGSSGRTVEHGSCVQEIIDSNSWSSQTYSQYTCHFLASCSALLWQGLIGSVSG